LRHQGPILLLNSIEMLLQLDHLQLAQKGCRISTKSSELLRRVLAWCGHHHRSNDILWLIRMRLRSDHSVLLKQLKGALRCCRLLDRLCLKLRLGRRCLGLLLGGSAYIPLRTRVWYYPLLRSLCCMLLLVLLLLLLKMLPQLKLELLLLRRHCCILGVRRYRIRKLRVGCFEMLRNRGRRIRAMLFREFYRCGKRHIHACSLSICL